MIARLYKKAITEQLEWIDAFRGESEPGPRSSRFKTTSALILSAVMLCFMNFIVLSGDFQTTLAQAISTTVERLPESSLQQTLANARPLFRNIAWSLGCVTFYLVIPATFVWLIFREPLTNYGISPRGFIKHLPIYLALFIPVLLALIVVSFTEAFQDTYPFYHHPRGFADLAIWEFFYCLQFFALEFFFRGFMVHAMKRMLGSMAVFVMVVPYCMIHFQKPFAEALAAIIAGTVLGILSLRTGTIWGGVFIHCAVAISMDVASLLQRGWWPV